MDVTDLRLFIMAIESPYNYWSDLEASKRIDYMSERFMLNELVIYNRDWLDRFHSVKTLIKESEITLDYIYEKVTANNLVYSPTDLLKWKGNKFYINEALDILMGKITLESDFLRYKITSQNIIDLASSEIEIILDPLPGFIIQISELFVVFNAGNTTYNNTTLRLYFENQGDILHIFDLDSTENQYFIAVPGVGFSSLKLSVLPGEENPINGNGTLDIYYKYRYVPLASDNIPI